MEPDDEFLFVVGDVTSLDPRPEIVEPPQPAALPAPIQPCTQHLTRRKHDRLDLLSLAGRSGKSVISIAAFPVSVTWFLTEYTHIHSLFHLLQWLERVRRRDRINLEQTARVIDKCTDVMPGDEQD